MNYVMEILLRLIRVNWQSPLENGTTNTIVGIILAVVGFFGQSHARADMMHCSYLDLVLSRRARYAFGYHCNCELMQFVLYGSYFVIVIGIIFAVIGFSNMIKKNEKQ